MNKSLISLILPSFNEEKNIPMIYEAIHNQMEPLSYNYELIFIDDGSQDHTLESIQMLASAHDQVKYISFTRNFGKEAAMLAGLEKSKGEAVIILDADLQHPSSLLPAMVEGYEEGYDQVIARRTRTGESPLRKALSSTFYKIINQLVDVTLENGIGDFRLLSRDVVNDILKLSEGNRFSKGLFSWVGYEEKVINYENVSRQEGDSKWSFSKLLNYAIDGLVSFNTKPLRVCFYAGLLTLLLSLGYISFIFIEIIRTGIAVPGYFSTISAILFLGGVQLLSLGVVGEYIGRIYNEVKRRPHYLVKDTNIHDTKDQFTQQ
ncbi:Glycosyltransferase involved in cell wall bisynthesis [Halobacillus alkaliphilus]|uniref:Glycosyltransferase involved in cell wall bisynthesis n=1 Tax=Halobacillus alkaliphilus TaxID=396056 RepID=A0A1I2PMW7_9BACI|nr:glycosyltransferase family 2 protein [Halobacillus alkaliphilus]SFG16920.1 Glycosyltransferase involved in cell wall bisynthesis [Halobacillus alkaliphilus]